MAVDVRDILAKLRKARQVGPGRWMACCPAHDDNSPSLAVSLSQSGRLLVHCFAGCHYRRVLECLDAGGDGYDAPPRETRPVSRPEFERLARDYRTAVRADHLARFARSLGLNPSPLIQLGIGWDAERRCWAFPMTDPAGRVLGVRLRTEQGRKFSVAGGHEGLFIPFDLAQRPRCLFLPEGPTSTAALLEMGVPAVGRPSCLGGRGLAIDLITSVRPARIVIVGDNDKPDQRGQRPGTIGARILATEAAAVHDDVRIVHPPHGFKDCRDWFIGGGRRDQLHDFARNARRVYPARRKGVVA